MDVTAAQSMLGEFCAMPIIAVEQDLLEREKPQSTETGRRP